MRIIFQLEYTMKKFDLDLIRHAAFKLWDNQSILQSVLSGESKFPLFVSLPNFKTQIILDNFIELRNNITDFVKKARQKNLTIIFKQINHRQLGEQQIPKQICFENINIWLKFINKLDEYNLFSQTIDNILSKEPKLMTWLILNTSQVVKYADKWDKLLKVYYYFKEGRQHKKYLRELDIIGVDSKFVEKNRAILNELLSFLLPETIEIESKHILFKRHNFEVKYGLKYVEPLIRFRVLDNNLTFKSHGGVLTDLSVPLSQFAQLNLACRKVFITENKINGLCFPDVTQAIVIFGLGYGIQLIKDIEWLKDKEIIYWGDIDTHGFAILSQLRGYFPQVNSIMMDKLTLNKFKHLSTIEDETARCTVSLTNLTFPEQELYTELINNVHGVNLRLEQERLDYNYVVQLFT